MSFPILCFAVGGSSRSVSGQRVSTALVVLTSSHYTSSRTKSLSKTMRSKPLSSVR